MITYLSKIFKKKQDVLKQNNITNNLATERLYIFDFLRFISCFLVCIGHTINKQHKVHIPSQLMLGTAMPIFFFITGYLIPMSLERCNVKQFIIKRFFRLIPVLCIATLFSCTIFHKYDVLKILGNIFMFTDLLNLNPKNAADMKQYYIVQQGWSMQVEIKFYLLAALSFLLLRRYSIRIKLYFMFFITFFVFLTINILHFKYLFNSFAMCCSLVACVLIGNIYYAFNCNKITSLEYFFLQSVSSILTVIAQPKYLSGVIVVNLICLVYKYSNFKYISFNNTFIKYLANLSYSMYLFHIVFFRIAEKVYAQHNSILILYRLEFLIICILVCHFVYKYIEKPCYDFGRKLAKKFN